jgi:hypothetical protein
LPHSVLLIRCTLTRFPVSNLTTPVAKCRCLDCFALKIVPAMTGIGRGAPHNAGTRKRLSLRGCFPSRGNPPFEIVVSRAFY